MGIWERIEGGECVVIAEVAQAHDGSLGTAHALIDVAAEAGADAVKFQTHIASAESTLDEPWRVAFSPQDETRFDYWRRMEFTPRQWQGLAAHAEERGIAFLSSPFSVEAVALLDEIGQPFWKIASGEVFNGELLDAVLATGRPVGISTGMATIGDLDAVIERCRAAGVSFALFQCTSAYPAPADEWGLGVIAELRERYERPVGFSDHSGSVAAGLAAAALGAAMVEVHITLSTAAFGPDVPASLDPDALAVLTAGVRDIVTARSSTLSKDDLTDGTAALRSIFGRSWAPVRRLPAGHVLERADLTLKKPGTGISEPELDTLIGRTLVRDISPGRLLRREDLA